MNLQEPIALLGYGVSHQALLRYLGSHDLPVTVYDQRPLEAMGEEGERLRALGVEVHAGAGYLEEGLSRYRTVFVTPGMPLDHPALLAAERAGARITGEIPLLLSVCPALTIGVTGSAGKSTTTALIGHLLEGWAGHLFVGGNIGRPLIEQVDRMTAADIAVLELSSFQLERTEDSPRVALLLNLAPNHLDHHRSMAEYGSAKARIAAFQRPGDLLIVNREDPEVWAMAREAPAAVRTFGLDPEGGTDAFLSREGVLSLRREGRNLPILARSELPLLGQHNVANALAAILAVDALGVPPEWMAEKLRTFRPIAHRLETVAEADGVRYVNDSIGTSPDRSLAALAALPGPILLLAGGSDKGLDYATFAAGMAGKVRHVLLMGPTADKIEAALQALPQGAPSRERCGSLAEAVERACSLARPGDTVLLSPASASFHEFRSYTERGERFRQAVRDWLARKR